MMIKSSWIGLQVPAGLTAKEISPQESMKALEGDSSPGLPTSVLPKGIQEKLDRGEKVDLNELVVAPIHVWPGMASE